MLHKNLESNITSFGVYDILVIYDLGDFVGMHCMISSIID